MFFIYQNVHKLIISLKKKNAEILILLITMFLKDFFIKNKEIHKSHEHLHHHILHHPSSSLNQIYVHTNTHSISLSISTSIF